MELTPENYSIVYFGVATSGFYKKDEILQIGAKCDKASFSVYLKPTVRVDYHSNELNNLQNINGELFLNDKKLMSLEAKFALKSFEQFLNKFKTPCVLLSYSHFHYNRLITLIHNNNMIDNFNIIAGFYDATNLFKKCPNVKVSNYKLETLSQVHLKKEKNFEALHDVRLVEELSEKLISKNDFYKCLLGYKHYKQCVEKIVSKPSGKSKLQNDNLSKIDLIMESYKGDIASGGMKINSRNSLVQGTNKKGNGMLDFFKEHKKSQRNPVVQGTYKKGSGISDYFKEHKKSQINRKKVIQIFE